MRKSVIVQNDVELENNIKLIKTRYALEVVRDEIIKLLILALLFILLGYKEEFFFAITFLFAIRIFSGGMHMKSNIGCFVMSFCFLFLPIVLLPQLHIPDYALLLIAGFSFLTISVLSPVASYKRPIKTASRKTFLKRMTLIVVFIECVVLAILWVNGSLEYFVVCVWVVSIQAIQLCATWTFRKQKGKNDVKKI